MSSRFVVRIAVGAPESPTSSAFRIWGQKSDVYASLRDRGHEVKVTLHGDGRCFAGLTDEFAKGESAALAALGGKRHQSAWQRPTHLGSRFATPLQIAIPCSELRSSPMALNPRDGVVWIPAPDVDYSVIISCGFSGQLLDDAEWPGKKNGTHLLHSGLLPNGEKLWVLWQYSPTSPIELDMLGAARRLRLQPGMVRFSAAESDSTPDSRHLIFKDFPDDRMLVVLDAAAG